MKRETGQNDLNYSHAPASNHKKKNFNLCICK